MKQLPLMYSYRGKIAAGIMILICLVGIIIIRAGDLIVFRNLNLTQTKSVFEFLLLAALFVFAYSREKVEDDKVAQIRFRSLQFTFYLCQCILLGLALSASLNLSVAITSKSLFLISAITLIFYLVTFHLALHIVSFQSSFVKSERFIYYFGGIITLLIVFAIMLV